MENYFTYLPASGAARAWGLEVTAVGYTHVQPGQVYPPARHPVDHQFVWSKGRMLDAHQLVLITQGAGELECGDAPRPLPIGPGDVFLLWPKLWHRYRPRLSTGWVEHWLECRGPAVERLQSAGVLNENRPVYHNVDIRQLLPVFERLHHSARRFRAASQPAMATLALHLYALIQQPHSDRHREPPTTAEQAVQRAQAIITDRAHEPLSVRDLAAELAVSESHLRRAFRQHLGLAPKQYHIQVRLRRARELLAGTNLSVREIADALGFDSPFHLSKQFRKHMGVAPSHWRVHQLGVGLRADRGWSIAIPPSVRSSAK